MCPVKGIAKSALAGVRMLPCRKHKPLQVRLTWKKEIRGVRRIGPGL